MNSARRGIEQRQQFQLVLRLSLKPPIFTDEKKGVNILLRMFTPFYFCVRLFFLGCQSRFELRFKECRVTQNLLIGFEFFLQKIERLLTARVGEFDN